MEKLQEDNLDKDTLSDEMLMLVVVNTASIQLIPTSIIALKSWHIIQKILQHSFADFNFQCSFNNRRNHNGKI